MTLSEIQAAIYRRVNLAASPTSEPVARILGYINEAYREILSHPNLRTLRHGAITFATVASQAEYGFPFGVARVLRLRDLDNQTALEPMGLDAYRVLEPDPVDNTGTPRAWAPVGYGPVSRQPSQTGLWVASSSASDTTQTVRVQAVRHDGTLDTLTATLTGTTRAQLGTNATYETVTVLSLSAAAVGTVSLFDASSSGNTLAVIPIGRTFSRYFVVALWPTPSSALSYAMDFDHAIVDLANATDEPLLPVDFHDLIVHGALMHEYEHRDDTRYAVARDHYQRRLLALRAWVNTASLSSGSARSTDWDRLNLGSWFPTYAP